MREHKRIIIINLTEQRTTSYFFFEQDFHNPSPELIHMHLVHNAQPQQQKFMKHSLMKPFA